MKEREHVFDHEAPLVVRAQPPIAAILWICLAMCSCNGFAANNSHISASPTNQPRSVDDLIHSIDERALADLTEQDLDRIIKSLPAKLDAIEALFNSQLKTERQIADLQGEARRIEEQIKAKSKMAAELQQQMDILKLTPQQLVALERYNRSISHDPGLVEWVTTRKQWWELGRMIAVSLFFLFFGGMLGAWWERKKTALRSRLSRKASPDVS
jgi:hypothetical protein